MTAPPLSSVKPFAVTLSSLGMREERVMTAIEEGLAARTTHMRVEVMVASHTREKESTMHYISTCGLILRSTLSP